MNEQLYSATSYPEISYSATSSTTSNYIASSGPCNIETTKTHSEILPTIQSYEEAMEYNWEYDVILSSSVLKKLTSRIKELESLNLEQWTSLIEEGDDNG